MAGGLGALGYLLFQSYSQFSDLNAEYEKQASDLQGLQTQPLYPEPANLARLKEQREAATAAAQSLQEQLAPMTFPLQAITSEQFQDKLRASVSATVDKARGLGVALPTKFYLGFDQYKSQPPKTEAASPLDRQLRAVELVINTMLENKVDSILKLDRPQLPEEGDAVRPTVQPGGQSARPGLKADVAKRDLFTKFPFEVQFIADQNRFRRVVNQLSKDSKQFFVIRPLKIQNTREKGLSKTDPAASFYKPVAAPEPAVASGTTAGAAPAAAPKVERPDNMRYLVGTEKLNVTLRFDMVVFPEAPAK